MCKLHNAWGWRQNTSHLTTKPLKQLCGDPGAGNITRLVECVERSTFNLTETVDYVFGYKDTNTAVKVDNINWKSAMTYTHTGMCHTMHYDQPISTAPIVLRLNAAPRQRLALMMHDPRFTMIQIDLNMVQSLWTTSKTPK